MGGAEKTAGDVTLLTGLFLLGRRVRVVLLPRQAPRSWPSRRLLACCRHAGELGWANGNWETWNCGREDLGR